MTYCIYYLLESWILTFEKQLKRKITKTARKMSSITSKTRFTDAQQKEQKHKILEQRINELRVAHQEITIVTSNSIHNNKSDSRNGSNTNNSNKVYIQLSSGSVAILTDRTVAEARVSRQLQNACDELESLI